MLSEPRSISLSNSLNASLGPTSQTSFDAGSLKFDQLTFNADIVRTFDTLLPGTTTLAFGAEYRDENFEIEAGEEASWIQGPFPATDYFGNPISPTAAAGSQVFPGFTPESAVDEGRDAGVPDGKLGHVVATLVLVGEPQARGVAAVDARGDGGAPLVAGPVGSRNGVP